MIDINYEYINNNTDTVIVFLHGWGLSGNSFDGIISSLDTSLSILKIDLYGFGNSAQPKDYFDTFEYSYQIFLLLNKLNIKNIILIGHSFGGRLSILLSSIYNYSVKACLLSSSAGLNKFNLKKIIKIKIYKMVKFLHNKKIIKGNRLTKFGSRDYCDATNVMKGILIKVVNQDLRLFAKNIKCKTYLVWDKKDKETPYWICKKLNKLIYKTKIVLFKNGGHFTAFKNRNKFAKIINNVVDNTK